MAATHTFFADESGHAGINYLDDGQPFHIEAGFVLPNEYLAEAEAAVRAEFPRGEVKGNKLLQSPSGQRRAVRLLRSMGAAHAMPIFIVMERWFAVSGKLVDVFLDPSHQDAVDWLSTSDFTQREEITEKLLRLLPEDVLSAFARAYRRPDVAQFQLVLRAVIERLEAQQEAGLARGFQGALNNLEYIVQQERYGDTPLEHAEWASLNLPAVMHLIRRVDLLMDGYGTYQMVHDRVLQFESVFARNINMYRVPGAAHSDIRLPDGSLHRVLFRNLESFTMADSTTAPMLQVADVLAASVARVMREVSSGELRLSEEMRELLPMILPLWLESAEFPVSLGAVYAQQKTKEALMDALMQCWQARRT